MNYDCATETAAGATLVTVRVRNGASVPRRARVRNELPGPVLPPRREGVPERGWDEDGFVGVVAAEDERTLGYACPVVCEDEPPVSVESLGRAESDAAATKRDGNLEAEAIRALGRARPPADAVPVPTASRRFADAADDDPSVAVDAAEDSAPTDDCDSPAQPERPVRSPAVDSWLDAAEARVRLAERLTDATAADAASALESAGDVSGLPPAVDADERALRSFAARASDLADRAAATDAGPVVAALETI